jgi:hypothetical protein
MKFIELKRDAEDFGPARFYFDPHSRGISIIVHSDPGWEAQILTDLTNENASES